MTTNPLNYVFLQSQVPIIHEVASKYFAPVIGISYVLAKLIIRDLIHRIVGHKYDMWGAFGWFGVDIVILSISVAVASKVHERLGLSMYEEIYIWYFCLVVCLFLSSLVYGGFMRRRVITKGKSPLRDFWLFTLLSLNWGIGFSLFIIVFNTFRPNK